MSPSDFRADLHMHSTASDGTFSPLELVDEAINRGLSAIALTDHDTIAGLLPAAKRAKERGLLFLTGCELSSAYEGISVHILGYGFDPENPGFLDFLQKQQKRREERNGKILQNLAKRGFIIDPCLLQAQESSALGRVHIAKAMLKQAYVQEIQEAFKRWIGDTAPCYERGVKPTPAECIVQIHAAGGKAFLAHPHLMPRKAAHYLIKSFAWDGLEVFYGRFLDSAISSWLGIAQKRGMLVSGGSDFHGNVKSEGYLGSQFIDYKRWQALIQECYWTP